MAGEKDTLSPYGGTLAENLAETQKALGEAHQWMKDWYVKFQEQTGLTPEQLNARFLLKRSGLYVSPEFVVHTDQGDGIYLINDLEYEMPSEFGTVSWVRIVHKSHIGTPVGAPDGMMIMTTVGKFDEIRCMSMGWALDESDVTYMNINSRHGKIRRLVQTTRPGILFDEPISQTRSDRQDLIMNFKYGDERLIAWNAELFPSSRQEEVAVNFHSRRGRLFAGRLLDRYNLPDTIDVPQAMRNIIDIKPAWRRTTE